MRSNARFVAFCATCLALGTWMGSNLSTSSRSPAARSVLAAAAEIQTSLDTLDLRCPFDTRALGGGFYRVFRVAARDSVVREVSQHVRLDKAVVSGARAKSETLSDSVWIEHDFELLIECPEPDLFAASDSATIVQARVEIDRRVEGGDTLWTVVAFDRRGAVIDSVDGRNYQLTALLWRGGEVVGCAGDCSDYPQALEIDMQRAARWASR